jgi:surface polysaccharide O-acyltransferase-like enzyme
LKQSVQTLRGLACVFLVAFHAIGSRPDKGLMMDDGTVLRHLADTFLYLRLPAFAFVAGLVYSFRSVQPGQLVGGFVLGKARRLLVPLLVVGSMQFALEAAAGGLDFRRIFWLPMFPHNHFWFLEAIFAIFVLVALLDRAGVLRRRAAVAAATLLAAAVCSLEVVTTHLLSADGAVYLLPFFFLGLCFGRFGDPLAIPGGVAIAWLLVAVGAVATQAGLLGLLDHPVPRTAPVGLLFGAAVCVLLVRTGWRNRGLELIGAYSYAIYLFHMFGVAGLRAALPEVGVRSPYLMFPLMLAAGLLLPILVELVASRHPLARALLLGQKPPRSSGAAPPGRAPLVCDGRLRDPTYRGAV